MLNKKDYFSNKAMIAYLEISIMIIATFAFAYMVSEPSGEKENRTNLNLIEYILVTLLDKLKQPILPMVSATVVSSDSVCCEKTNEGNICQMVAPDDCNSSYKSAPTTCDETEFCQPGCCLSPEGLCSANSVESGCISGKWFADASCNVKECERACCILGDQAKFTTEENCKKESADRGLEMDFEANVKTELECLYITQKEDKGACVIVTDDGNGCKYTTRDDCKSKKGNFYTGYFCSNPSLNTTCQAMNSTGCLDGEDSVYWFDSCGNPENVSEACNLFLGTKCGEVRAGIDTKPSTGDYVCRDLSCQVEIYGEKVTKKNGESWCEYEGTIGDGKDTVGSRYAKHICFMGEERLELCSDYRNQICVQSDTNLSNNDKFTEAACRVNQWRSCFAYNQLGNTEMPKKCATNPDCKIQSINVDKDGFKFDICVPNYPPGFDSQTDDGMKNGEAECALASQKCTVVYVKRISGWECEANCNCEKQTFVQQMNDFCTSLGDCGAYTNYVGKVTDDGYSISGIDGADFKRLSQDYLNGLSKYSLDKSGQAAKPGDFGFSQILGIPGDLGQPDINKKTDYSMIGMGLAGLGMLQGGAATASAVGGAARVGSIFSNVIYQTGGQTYTGLQAMEVGWLDVNPATMESNGAFSLSNGATAPGEVQTATKAGQTGQAAQNPGSSAFGNVLGGIGAGMAVAGFLQAGFGMDSTTSYGIGLAIAIVTALGWCPPCAIIGLIISVVSMIAGLGDTKERVVDFKCLPWQPPLGGNDCEKCNTNNPLEIPCSEYRCHSLGQGCEFINKGMENELCIYNDPTDVNSPRISPGTNISEGLKYWSINDKGFKINLMDGKCIPEYKLVTFEIETDKPAQCKIGKDAMQSYEDMSDFFGDKNSYIINHTMSFIMPSPAAFANRYNLTEEQLRDFGDMTFYIKCQSVNGVSNSVPYIVKTCVNPGPDIMAPMITKIIPETNGFSSFDSENKSVIFYVNEPSDCRWSFNDEGYDSMTNNFSCNTDPTYYDLYGWKCTGELKLNNQSTYYIKCRDQPWLGDNSSRNTMAESFVYTINPSKSELKIDSSYPTEGEEIIAATQPFSLKMELKTSGGAEDGKAVCSWSSGEYSDYFTTTNSSSHSYQFATLTDGNYEISFKCTDSAGNVAENSTAFTLKIDNIGPKIIRIYNEGGLKVITNEDSECRYDTTGNFNFDNATVMDGSGIGHVGEWKIGDYYIQCKDSFGNLGTEISVRSYNLISSGGVLIPGSSQAIIL